jgi:hypothetical protein
MWALNVLFYRWCCFANASCFLRLVTITGIISIAVHNHDVNQHGAILRYLDIMILRLGDLNFCIFSILISAANEREIQAFSSFFSPPNATFCRDDI